MIRLQLQVDLAYAVDAPGADFFFYIHAALTPQQQVPQEWLQVVPEQAVWRLEAPDAQGSRCLRLRAPPGPLAVQYQATIEMAHHAIAPGLIPEQPIYELPPDVVRYIHPSRYCQSDRLYAFAHAEFGDVQGGYARAQAICDWVREHVLFRSNTSDASTSAVDTLLSRMGVCRDFAHLMVALCRASNLPARVATGTDFGADLALGPPDFHAYVEVFLGGRWYLFDPSGTAIPMGMVRLATGRDAADVAFATIFGSVRSEAPRIQTTVLQDLEHGGLQPTHTALALSTA